ncbi:MAG: hypothetical protein AB7T32_09875 [Dehalococcoidia bacterium]
MPKSQLAAIIAGVAVIATAVIFGGFVLAEIDGTKRQTTASSAGPTATSTSTPGRQTTSTPAPTAVPATPTPSTAQGFPGLPTLPPNIRQQIENGASMTQEQIEALISRRTSAIRIGEVTRVRGNELTFETIQGDSYTTRITKDTAIRLGAKVLKPSDIKVGDTVFVISIDGGETAFSISSFGALADIP